MTARQPHVQVAWMREAACRDEDPELFFPISAAGAGLAQANEAKGVCEICPVRAACLSYALQTNQEAGIWGGATEEERRRMRRGAQWRRRRARQASYADSTESAGWNPATEPTAWAN